MQINRIALALAFSPRLEANLAEAARLNKLFQSHLYLIHVGDYTAGNEQELQQLLERFNLTKQNCTVLWQEGETVDTILETCKERHTDLLITGALEKEGLLQYYMGSVARQLSRKAQCSVLMLTEPSTEPHPFRNIVVSGGESSHTADTIALAMHLAKLEKANKVDIIQESEYHNIARLSSENKTADEVDQIKQEFISEDKEKLDEILSCTDCGSLKIERHHLEGKPGFAISNYAREHEADLLVLSSPDKKLNLLDRLFTHDIEHVLANLPCSVLIVHHENLN